MKCDTNKGLCVKGKIQFLTFDLLIYIIQYLGCSTNEDCKRLNERCDLVDQICRQQCTTNEDCKGGNKKCDTNKGLCVHNGKIQFLTALI